MSKAMEVSKEDFEQYVLETLRNARSSEVQVFPSGEEMHFADGSLVGLYCEEQYFVYV